MPPLRSVPTVMDIARGAAIDSPSMIHTCDRSVIHFGEGASPALDFLLRLPPVAMLAVIVAGSCSDNGLLASRLDLAGWLPACACMYTSASVRASCRMILSLLALPRLWVMGKQCGMGDCR